LYSWLVWSATGLFPVCGQPLMFIGSPLFVKSCWHLPGGDFSVECEGHGEERDFIREATLNGVPLARAWLRLEEFRSGGHLRLSMSDEPSEFGTRLLPPSWKPCCRRNPAGPGTEDALPAPIVPACPNRSPDLMTSSERQSRIQNAEFLVRAVPII